MYLANRQKAVAVYLSSSDIPGLSTACQSIEALFPVFRRQVDALSGGGDFGRNSGGERCALAEVEELRFIARSQVLGWVKGQGATIAKYLSSDLLGPRPSVLLRWFKHGPQQTSGSGGRAGSGHKLPTRSAEAEEEGLSDALCQKLQIAERE